MFPKLYRYLEEMNSNLRQQEETILQRNKLQEKANLQLDEVNRSLVSQNRLIASFMEKNSPETMQKTSLLICCAGIILTAICLSLFVQFYRTTSNLENTITVLGRNNSSGQIDTQKKGPQGKDENYKWQLSTERQVVRLDSLINEQAQSIKELKSLNGVAIHTLIHIRKILEKSHMNLPNPGHTDSLTNTVGSVR